MTVAAARPIYTKYGTNVSPCSGQKKTRAIFEEFKNQVTTTKNIKISQFFTPVVTFSLVVTKRLKIPENLFAMTPRVLYLSENVIAIVQNSPVFSNTLLNGASKKTDFDGYYLDNDESYDQS